MKWMYLAMGILAAGGASAQDEITYTRQYEKGGTGVTAVNPALKANAPDAAKTFVLITGITFTECDKKGQPKRKFRETLTTITDALTRQIQLLGNSVQAGHFTYNCNRTGYYYLKDTADMRTVLETFYRQNFPEYPYHIHMRPDPQWSAYLQYLYPDKTRAPALPPQH